MVTRNWLQRDSEPVEQRTHLATRKHDRLGVPYKFWWTKQGNMQRCISQRWHERGQRTVHNYLTLVKEFPFNIGHADRGNAFVITATAHGYDS